MVPTLLKVNENSFPRPRLPLSHSSDRSGETPAVAVCGAVSRFTHVTVVPTDTVRSSSVKSAISDCIEFAASDEAGAEVGAAAVVGSGADVGEAGVDEDSLPQATSVTPTITAAIKAQFLNLRFI